MKAKFIVEFESGVTFEVIAQNGEEAIRSIVGEKLKIDYMYLSLKDMAVKYSVTGGDQPAVVKAKYVTSAIKGQS